MISGVVWPCESDPLADVGRMVSHYFHDVIVGHQDALLLELVEVAEPGEPFLREGEKAGVLKLATPLTNEKGISLQCKPVCVIRVEVTALLICQEVVRGKVPDHVPLASFELLEPFLRQFDVRVL